VKLGRSQARRLGGRCRHGNASWVAVIILALSTLAAPLPADGQQPAKIPRIEYLSPRPGPSFYDEAFLKGLRDLGYAEGRNIAIEYRWANWGSDRLAAFAADLVRLKVEVIVSTGGSATALAARKATQEIPITFITANPVGLGLVASLARPGGNITGFASLYDEMPGKWMELLKEALPRVSRVAVLWDPAGDPDQVRTSEAAARSLGVRLQVLKVGRPDDFGTAFAEAQKNHAEALIVLSSAFFYAHRSRLVELAAKQRLPTMYHQKDFVVGSGGLMAYGPDFHDLFRRSATYVDKILKGAKPADLPVEQPSKFELVINLKMPRRSG
jgi:putative ABC transport system substrate-binding protein